MDGPATMFSESPDDPFSLRRAASAVLDAHGTVVGWSRRAEELLGYRPEAAVGRSAADFLLDPDDQGQVMDAAAACVQSLGWFGILSVRHRDGHRVRLGCRAHCVLRSAPASTDWLVVGAPAEEVVQWETDRSLLEGLFSRSPIGLTIHAADDLRILRTNRAIARAGGMSPERMRGLHIGDFLIGPDAELVESRLRQVLETGKPIIFTEQPCRLHRDPDRERFVSVSAFRVEDSSGRSLGVADLVEDVTDRYLARRRLALLNKASARIGTTLDVAQTARELADVAVPDLADCVSVDLLEPVGRGEEPLEAFGPVRRTAVASVTARALEVLYPVGELIRYAPDMPQGQCLIDNRAVLVPDLAAVARVSISEPEREQRALSLGVHSLMVVPLAARGLVLGLVSLWRSRRPVPFEEDDLTLAHEFAHRAAVCIDNARRYTEQHQAALALQRRLLPREVPELSAVEVAHRYQPAGASAGVGGDWFDVIPLSGARVALVVGDVVGHGINAAATMGRLRTAVRTLADLDLQPDEILSHLDDLVNRLAAEQEGDGQLTGDEQVVGATCLYGVYDPVSRRCTLARAGHPPPVVVSPDRRVILLDLPAGPPLGVGGLPFEEAELELDEGSLLTLYTNGLLDSPPAGVEDSLSRMLEELVVPDRPLEETSKAVVDTLLPARPSDDVALLIARTRVLPAEQVATWQLPSEPTAAAHARSLAEAQLAAWGLDELTFSTELIVSELVTNAYRYADGPMSLRLIKDRCLICEVSDPSSTSPHLRRARSTDEGGRGLFLVAQFAERWGTRYAHGGKTVWTEQPLPSAGASRATTADAVAAAG